MTDPAGLTPTVDAHRLAESIRRPGGIYTQVDVVADTGSTNADLAAAARTDPAAGRVLVSDHQSAGRGRRNRGWSAAPGTSQAISMSWRPSRTEQWSWLSLILGIAVADTARAVGVAAGLKWPNDVLVGGASTADTGRKLAGLLSERVDTADGAVCVLGIGLNTTATQADLPVPTATSLALAGAPHLDVTAVVSDLLVRLEKLLLWWESGEQDDLLLDLYLNRCTTLGRQVRVDLGQGQLVGEAVRIDTDGSLVVRADGHDHTVVAGDVVHLR